MSCWCSLVFDFILYGSSAFLLLISLFRFLIAKQPKIKRNEKEKFYFSFKENKDKQFPDLILSDQKIDYKPTVYLSVIVPAYNEEKRLPNMLKETTEYLEKQKFNYEIIVVDEGVLVQIILGAT